MDSRLLHPLSIAIAISVALAGNALAAPGDMFEVTAARANLRAGPSTQTEVVGQAVEGDRLVERRRQGEWVEARRADGTDGSVWIHSSLLRPSTAPAGAPAAASTSGASAAGSPFAQFREAIDGLNRQSRQRGGVAYYEKVEETEPGTVRLTVGKAWESVPASNRKSSLDALADLWRVFVPDGRPATIAIADADGRELDRRARPSP